MFDPLLETAERIIEQAEFDPICRQAIAVLASLAPIPLMDLPEAAAYRAGVLVEAHDRLLRAEAFHQQNSAHGLSTTVSGDPFNRSHVNPLEFMARMRRQSRTHGTNHSGERQ